MPESEDSIDEQETPSPDERLLSDAELAEATGGFRNVGSRRAMDQGDGDSEAGSYSGPVNPP